ncbi:hypothetical protein L1987_52271 [Smallanthus sonchifolius]|uniref:Uncharacterized protein n=1 Tax=Smallanthus sonchifolius TaxID=185202 RepID=A0ACB9ESC4_9ASTR|nr:hypothetical protein L1987_52271 [Smallanthus sonchifolius]
MAISPATTAATAAVDALLKWKTKQTDSNTLQLLPQDDFIYLILTLKKIPQKGSGVRTNPNKIPLPHPIVSPDSSELCLIIDDRPNSNLSSESAKKKIKSDGISVTKVIKLSKLRTDYKPFESKRKLCDSYDMFFADKRIIPLLPKLLGKQFFKKKKLPLGVDLSHKNWKEQIERGCSSGLLFVRTGTCCVIRVAKISMERDEIVENVRAAIDGVVGFVPKKLAGVRSLHLKFSDSVALPLFQSLPDIKLKIEGVREERVERVESKYGGIETNDVVGSELNVDDGGGSDTKKRKGDGVEVGKKKRSKTGKRDEAGDDLVEGKPDKKSIKEKKVSKKGKRDEVTNDLDPDEVVNEEKPAKKSGKEKKRKGNVVEEDVNAKSSDKVAKKKGKKQSGDSGKKEKKKGRSV